MIEENNTVQYNRIYSLAKERKTGEWVLGKWTNDWLWSVDGENTRICRGSAMTRWKFLTETRNYTHNGPSLPCGSRIIVEGANGLATQYWVLDAIGKTKNKYVIGR